MPVFQLPDEIIFPDPELANPDGIIAIGGDLSPERILTAYQNGIFPWFSEEDPLLWWSPDPRMVLSPNSIKISKSMKQVIKKGEFSVSYDTQFETVIRSCSKPRIGQDNIWVWLNESMIKAYMELHKLGFAHSVEVWKEDEIVGGLYGISLGGVFYGESMFTKVSNASKFGFISLVNHLSNRKFGLIDCQVHTSHLESLGAIEIERSLFLKKLKNELKKPTLRGSWCNLFNQK